MIAATVGSALTVIVEDPVNVLLHVFEASVTETNVNVWSTVIAVSVTTTDPPPPIVAVVFAPPLTLYVTTCPAVPDNVN